MRNKKEEHVMTKKHIATIFLTAAALMTSSQAVAGNLIDSLQIKARVGYSIGGTAPIPLPATIRSIDAYRLTPSIMAGFDALIPLNNQWGIMTGLYVENKAMDGDVTTKAYRMEMVKGNTSLSGLFTGHVKQEVTEWMLTLPVKATMKLNSKWTLRGGPYVSLLLSKEFSGIASDGYLRQDTPTGAKVLIGTKEGEWATYEFNDDMRSFQFGVGIGADWQFYKNFGASLDLNWGLTGIFKSDFKTVEQTLYPIYGTIGFFYRIK